MKRDSPERMDCYIRNMIKAARQENKREGARPPARMYDTDVSGSL